MPTRRTAVEVQDRFGLLLVLLVAAFVMLGFAAHTWARVLAGVLEVLALAVGFLATGVREDRRSLTVFGFVGIVGIVLAAMSGDVATGLGAIAGAVLLLALLVRVLHSVLRHRRVTIQTLFAAVCAYFLIGLFFSSTYLAMNAFSSEPIFGDEVAPSVYSYFSFVTMTTVGYGDYTVKTDLARRVVVIEAVFGQLFLATALARLVSLYKSTPAADEADPPPTERASSS